MCTAVKYVSGDLYFGRTLDNSCSYGEEIVITPRRYMFNLRDGRVMCAHNAVVGVAVVADGCPLYCDAVNEKGLCMAGLNFVGNAKFRDPVEGKNNIATFEFIPYILGNFGSVKQARRALSDINITNLSFNESLPPAELHWIIADRAEAIVVESDASGVHVYDDPAGVLTNNPPFPQQMTNLNNYMHLSPRPPECGFSDKLELNAYSLGMGAIGLPGDLSSESRFVRAAFTALNSPECEDCDKSVGQYFHILDSVSQTYGSCILGDGKYEVTVYTSCYNATRGIYYYNTYDNRRIIGVDMHEENLDGTTLVRYPFLKETQILMQNKKSSRF